MPPTQLSQFTYRSPPTPSPTPIPPPSPTFEDWWSAQLKQHPFLSPTFDPWRATVPVLRRSLTTLGFPTTPGARKPALVRAFEDSAPLLIPQFEANLKACFPPLPPQPLRPRGIKRSRGKRDNDQGQRQEEEKEAEENEGTKTQLELKRQRLARLNRDELDDLVQLRDDMRAAEKRLELSMREFESVRWKVQRLMDELNRGLVGLDDARAKCAEWGKNPSRFLIKPSSRKKKMPNTRSNAMPSPSKALTESEYWDEQCASYPFLADDFDATKLRVPVLRNTLGALDIDFPSNARKAELVQLFNDHSAGPISAFREYVRKGYADFAAKEEEDERKKRKEAEKQTTEDTEARKTKTPAAVATDDAPPPAPDEPATPDPEEAAAHHTRLWVSGALGPLRQEKVSELYGSLLPLAGIDPQGHDEGMQWPVEDVVRVLGSAPFERRFKAISAMLDLERDRRERGEQPDTPVYPRPPPGGGDGGEAGASAARKRRRRDAVLQAAKRVKVTPEEDAAFRKLLQQARTAAFEELEEAAMDFDTSKKACLNEIELMTDAVDEMRRNWTLLRNAGTDVEELIDEFSQVED
ncbi:uncharacterized protein PpBr36_10713 [Pyricularia pennisetigena]|uniref:uncharacterized protein n=1 Tax=Pyricularia pennisetigena TaxID=1578925 RepID=UPI001151BCD6|nr:uncharacterized protein PpBr36_10713 [Pyricularia pennisetigena]TLS20908.1 hypothetical protein PpBr36_10713 [Pyricularia pennisetigena]